MARGENREWVSERGVSHVTVCPGNAVAAAGRTTELGAPRRNCLAPHPRVCDHFAAVSGSLRDSSDVESSACQKPACNQSLDIYINGRSSCSRGGDPLPRYRPPVEPEATRASCIQKVYICVLQGLSCIVLFRYGFHKSRSRFPSRTGWTGTLGKTPNRSYTRSGQL